MQAANLYYAGDFDGALSLLLHVRSSRQAAPSSTGTSGPGAVSGRGDARGAQGLVNGVHMDVVGLALWPAALACQRCPAEEAEAALEEVLACAEACQHPLTRCCALTSLCREYFCIAGDRARGVALADQAQGLATTHSLGHCSRSESARGTASR